MPRSSRLPRRRSGFYPRTALLQFLGEHHDDAAGAADIGELVDVPVCRNAAQRVTTVPRGDLEGLVDVVDRESDAVHADLVRQGWLRLDRVGVDVLEELQAAVAVWRLEHGDVGVVAVEADGRVGPLSADRVTAEDGQPEVGEEVDRRVEVADGDADVLEFDGHALNAIKSGNLPRSVKLAAAVPRGEPHTGTPQLRGLGRGSVSHMTRPVEIPAQEPMRDT